MMESWKLKVVLLVLSVWIVEESYGRVWETRETHSSPRGRGQISPVEYELGPQDLQEQLRDIGKSMNKRAKRQSVDDAIADDFSTTAILTNDSHFHALVHWTGFPNENIFILTRQLSSGVSAESWLWRSTDYGVAFVNDTTKFDNNSIIQYYYISPNTSNLIFADVVNKKLYLTRDTGDTYTAIDVPFTPNHLLFQNRYATHTRDYYQLVLGYDSDQQSLWVSTDLGITWNQIGTNVPRLRYYWRRLEADVEGDLTTVYFEQRLTNDSDESLLYVSVYPYTNVRLFNPQLGTFISESFVLEQEYMFVQKPWLSLNQNLTHSSSLLVSYRRSPLFRQAMFPLFADDLEHLHFSVVDASEGFVFLVVYHNENDTHLYISDVEGIQYVLSLENIAASDIETWIDDRPRYDVHIAEGLIGVVMANQKFPDRRFGSTLISRNKGGSWGPLNPPALASNGNPLLCVPPACSLHLRMETDQNSYQSILSQETAVGLIMASGNTGPNLARSAVFARVYLSRDGGFTWVEVRNGRWEFQFLALGSIIVMVRKNFLVDEFVWSCDEGQTWQSGVLEDTPRSRIAVIGMKTEIGERPRFVSIFGLDYFMYIQNDFVFEWIVFTLNFTSVVNRQCETVDYFDWMPSDGGTEEQGCLLGEVVSYQRRNSSLCCYVDPDYQKPTDRFTCTCSLEDFECDFGFQREDMNGACVPAPGFIWPPAPPAYCPEGQNYTYSSGYRKIPGDRCDDEEVRSIYQPRSEMCPVRQAGRLSISYSPDPARPETTITFTLSQQEGSTISTVYLWQFNGTSSGPLFFRGLNAARLTEQMYSSPGVYSVSVLTDNSAGQTTSPPLIFPVFDIVTRFQVDFPSVVDLGSIPVNMYFDYNVLLETQYNTMIISSEEDPIFWDFGDNTTISRSNPIAGYRYQSIGNYTITIRVNAAIATVDTSVTRNIRTYYATQSLTLVAESLVVGVGGKYAVVGRPVVFTALPEANTEISPDAVIDWSLSSSGNSIPIDESSTVLNYTIPSWGEYTVSVTGTVPTLGKTLRASTMLQALNELRSFSLEHKTMFKAGSFISITVSLVDGYNRVYTGPITLTALLSNGRRLDTFQAEIDGSETIILGFSIEGKGVSDITIVAQNAISAASSNISLTTVGIGEYGDVSIFFNLGQLPADDEQFLDKFTKAVAKLAERYAPDSIVEIDSIDSSRPTRGKRQLEDLYYIINLRILPGAYTDEAIEEALVAASAIVDDVRNAEFIVTVDDRTIKADRAVDRNSNEPPPTAAPASTVPVVEIVVAIVFVVVIVALAVGLVVIILICRKRYNDLQNKYTHLDETAAGGTLTFNDAFGDQQLKKTNDYEVLDAVKKEEDKPQE